MSIQTIVIRFEFKLEYDKQKFKIKKKHVVIAAITTVTTAGLSKINSIISKLSISQNS
jgi:hypothetical protein